MKGLGACSCGPPGVLPFCSGRWYDQEDGEGDEDEDEDDMENDDELGPDADRGESPV